MTDTTSQLLKKILYERAMQSREEKKTLFIKINNGKPLSEKAMKKYELNHLSFEEWLDLQYKYLEEEEEEDECETCGKSYDECETCECHNDAMCLELCKKEKPWLYNQDEEECNFCGSNVAGDKDDNYTTNDDGENIWLCDKCYCGE